MLECLRSDLPPVLHGLRSSPGLVLVAVLTLAGAIGVNVAILGLADRALLSPAHGLKNPDALVAVVFEHQDENGGSQRMTTTSFPAFRTLRDDVPALEGVAAWQAGPPGVVLGGEQVTAATMLVSSNYLEVLGAVPQIGPAAIGEEAVAIISHRFWIAAFGGDPGILGRRLASGGVEFEIGAVMGPGFGGHVPAAVDVWLPIEHAASGSPDWDAPYRNVVSLVARVAGDGTAAAAATQASAVLNRGVAFVPLPGSTVAERERRIAIWLSGVSLVILLIGLANAATLLLVRAARRRHESAIRLALGAGRRRLLTQLALEALLIGAAATLAAVVFGIWLDEAVRRILLPGIIERFGATARVSAGAVGAGVVAAVAAFAAGASHVPRDSRPGDMKEDRGRSAGTLRRGLLTVQLALSVLLLAGAGMFGRSLYALLDQDFGFTTEGVIVADLEPGQAVAAQDDMFRAALERIRRLPEVESASAYRSLPFSNFHVPPISIPGLPEPPQVGQQLPFLIAATPELLAILDIRMLQGRGFVTADDRGAPVVIVNETMARTVWPGQRAVGKCIRIGFDPDFDPFTATGPPVPSAAVPCREVVGVAADVRQRSVVPTGSEDRLMQYYVPFSQVPAPPAGIGPGPQINGLLVKVRGTTDAAADPIRRLLVAGRSDLPHVRVRPFAVILAGQVRPWQLGTTLLGVFSTLAVVMAGIGLYAAFTHAVTRRRREMAIRLAVGATPGSVRALVLRDAGILTARAAVAGCVTAVVAGRSLQALLYGIVPADPAVLGAAVLSMMAVSLAATLLPAWAASRSDPGTLLRQE